MFPVGYGAFFLHDINHLLEKQRPNGFSDRTLYSDQLENLDPDILISI